MRPRNRACEREPETNPTRSWIARSIPPLERFEHPFEVRVRNAGALVVDVHQCFLPPARNPAAGTAAVFHGIVQQIAKEAAQGEGIAEDFYRNSVRDTNIDSGLRQIVDDRRDEGREIHSMPADPLLASRKGQNAAYHGVHALNVTNNRCRFPGREILCPDPKAR